MKELATRKGFSGRGYISLATAITAKAECNVVITTAGRYVVDIRVVGPEDAKIVLTVGTTRKALSVSSTKSDSWAGSEWISMDADLSEGSNTIVLTASEISGSPIEIDRFEVTFKQSAQSTEGTAKAQKTEL